MKPAVSGPRRPHDRIDLPALKSKFQELMKKPFVDGGYGKADEIPDCAHRRPRTASTSATATC